MANAQQIKTSELRYRRLFEAALLMAVDTALYRAKQAGRNCVVVAG